MKSLLACSTLCVTLSTQPLLAFGHDAPKASATTSALDAALAASDARNTQALAPASRSWFDAWKLSLTTSIAAGCSDASGSELLELQGGGHAPAECGLHWLASELSLTGELSSYLQFKSQLVILPGELELEETYLLSSNLPAALELKAGYFLTEFGRLNPTHSHSWHWQDRPIIASRLLGHDGLRGGGLRLSWLLPGSDFSTLTLSAQNPDDDSMSSFRGQGHSHGHGHEHEHEHLADSDADDHDHEEHDEQESLAFDGIGGSLQQRHSNRSASDLLYLLRWQQSWDLDAEQALSWGLSSLFGPNASGRAAKTRIDGLDLQYRWQPQTHFRGTPQVLWQTELMQRRFEVAEFDSPEHGTPATRLRDWGYFSQLVHQFQPNWAWGIRYEVARGQGELASRPRAQDWERADRVRISPMLSYSPVHAARFRLQYNHDQADPLSGNGQANSLWLGFEFRLGSHQAHDF